MNIDLQDLVKTTIARPRDAAVEVIRVGRDISTEALWSAVILVAVLHALISSLELAIFPPPPELARAIPGFFFKPALLAAVAAGAIVISIFAIYWTGRALGGKGGLRDVMALFTWLEFMLVGAQVISLVLAFLAPPLADLVNLAAFFWGLWVLVTFVDCAFGFANPFKALGVLALALGLMVIGLMIFGLFLGVTALGVSNDV